MHKGGQGGWKGKKMGRKNRSNRKQGSKKWRRMKGERIRKKSKRREGYEVKKNGKREKNGRKKRWILTKKKTKLIKITWQRGERGQIRVHSLCFSYGITSG